jgi:hypothetical protein
MRTQQQQAVWNDFANSSDFQSVEEILKEGRAVVVVLGDGYSAYAYGAPEEMANPHLIAVQIQKEMVQQSGVPLPVGDDGRSRFALLVWKAGDAICAPSELCTVALSNETDLALIPVLLATGHAEYLGRVE